MRERVDDIKTEEQEKCCVENKIFYGTKQHNQPNSFPQEDPSRECTLCGRAARQNPRWERRGRLAGTGTPARENEKLRRKEKLKQKYCEAAVPLVARPAGDGEEGRAGSVPARTQQENKKKTKEQTWSEPSLRQGPRAPPSKSTPQAANPQQSSPTVNFCLSKV